MPEDTYDKALVAFLKWCLPRLGMRYAGFRKVRGQVGKRIRSHLAASGLDVGPAGLTEYQVRLEKLPVDHEEWSTLDHFCRVTISRFYRDAPVFDLVRDRVLPVLLAAANRKGRGLKFWSAGCASGEEAWTMAIIGHICFPTMPLSILGTDVDPHVLARAQRATYPESSLRELPEGWRQLAFEPYKNSGEEEPGEEWQLLQEMRKGVTFEQHDVREEPPDGDFDLILCRNLAFTYFGEDVQRGVTAHFSNSLRKGGVLVVGSGERLPKPVDGFDEWFDTWGIWRRG